MGVNTCRKTKRHEEIKSELKLLPPSEKRKEVKTVTPSPYALQKAKLFNVSKKKNDQGRPTLQKAEGASEQRRRDSALKLAALFPPLSLRRDQDLEITAEEELEAKLERQRKPHRRTLIESSIVSSCCCQW
jgi:hypothetical protein